ncbi:MULTISPECIES: sporulation integral membrane protein YlbJ [unclassified Virgibacillus]|uniref:sporulation integral membrane protein YlbJ n=1 Tax=unclassified Virgibacillus TaxID=2620237 RepID=UPI0024DEDEB1|nr:sporulation integral membrane protein YlbJ [Virgibacillus sp. LDC-1]
MRQLMKTILLSGFTIFIAISLVTFPKDAFDASLHGLDMWWGIVFPSLLPFFITAELLLSFGVVKFLGVLFEPIMRPLFNVPGTGSFAWIMGMASGYPTGAKITVRLREEKQLTRIEAERLVAFSNASSPLFIFGAVSVGFFYDPKLGLLIATCHYVGNAIVGILMRFYGRSQERPTNNQKEKVSFFRAFRAMHETRIHDPRPFGEILGDAVLSSIKTLVMVGGFIILFSVLTKILYLVKITPMIATFFESILSLFSIPGELTLPFISGLFEITIGANMISNTTEAPLLASIIIISFILGFNGLSIQAQVASILAKTDIRFLPYFFGRILHGFIAALLTVLLYRPLYTERPAFFQSNPVPAFQMVFENHWSATMQFIQDFGPAITILFLGISAILLLQRASHNR